MNKNIVIIGLFLATCSLSLSSCLEETFPQGGTITAEQKAQVEAAILSTGVGMDAWMNNYETEGGNTGHTDFGYPALMIMRDLLGQDMVYNPQYNQFGTFYGVGVALGPDYAFCQFPWRWYYKWAFNANELITLVPDPDTASPEVVAALGKAYFYRAFAYFDLARLYLAGSYANNPDGLTVPRVIETTVDVANNPRLTASELYPLILADLDKAALYLKDVPASNKNVPTPAAVYGLYARIHLELGNWAEAESYAKQAQAGYTPLTQDQWLDKKTGFNTPDGNTSWIWCTSVTANNEVVKSGIINWTAFMSPEQYYGYNGPGGGNSGFFIDRHLFDLIPSTDFRKKSFKEPGLLPAQLESNFPDVASLPNYSAFKFRPGKGETNDYMIGSATSVPLMRVEEMILIEAEAAARQNAARGKTVLENFVKTYRDPAYVSTGAASDIVVDEIWLQRRIELWGEGFATFDIKRLNKGITRSYTGTNHPTGKRFNTNTQPAWMNYCIVRTEFNNNFSIDPDENNPAPVTPSDSDPAW
ncbi:MAG: RagB/SusD family nutrient uptake outer membrane protein [Candidatus Symbiothrix sp.]|jgi:tetratricopeptide (TPR) repeat protein|nr:RagB/SusD family nutrient uptake outer membrane protein [Candidatus Symbiothrix sp.]